MFNDLDNMSLNPVYTQNVKAYPSINSPNSGGFNDEINMKWISKKFTSKPFVIDTDTAFKKKKQTANTLYISSGSVCIDGYMVRLASAGKTAFDADNDGTIMLNFRYTDRFIDDLVGNGTDTPIKSDLSDILFSEYNPDATSDYSEIDANWGTAKLSKSCVGYTCIVYSGTYYSELTIEGNTVRYGTYEIPIKSNSITYSSTPDEIKTAQGTDNGKSFAIHDTTNSKITIFYPLFTDMKFTDIFGILFTFSANIIESKCYPNTNSVYMDMDTNAPLESLSFTGCNETTIPSEVYDFESLYDSNSVRYTYENADSMSFTGTTLSGVPTDILNKISLSTLLSDYMPQSQTAITEVRNNLDYYCLILSGVYASKLLPINGTTKYAQVAFMTSDGKLCPDGFVSDGASARYPVEGYMHFIKRLYLEYDGTVGSASESEISAVTLTQICSASWFSGFYNTYLGKAVCAYLHMAYSSLLENVAWYNNSNVEKMKAIGCGKALNGTTGTTPVDFGVMQDYQYTGYTYNEGTDAFDPETMTDTILYDDDLTSDNAKYATAIADFPTYTGQNIPFTYYKKISDTVDISGTDYNVIPITVEDPIHYIKRCCVTGFGDTTIQSMQIYKISDSGTMVQCTKTISSSGGIASNVLLDENLMPRLLNFTVGEDDDCNVHMRTHQTEDEYGQIQFTSSVNGLCLDMLTYTWFANLPTYLTITKDGLNYLAGKDFNEPNKYLGCSIITGLSFDDSSKYACLFNMRIPTNSTNVYPDTESKYINTDTDSDIAKVARDAYIDVDRIYDPDNMQSINEYIWDITGDMKSQIDNLTQIINNLQSALNETQMMYYHNRVSISDRETIYGVTPQPRMYGLQPNSKVAIKLDLYYIQNNVHYPIDYYAAQIYQVTDGGATQAPYKYNGDVTTEFYYSMFSVSTAQAGGVIIITNGSDALVDDIVFDVQVSRNLYATILPSDTTCDVKTLCAVVLSDTSKAMAVSDTDTLTATIIKDSDNSVTQTIVWSSDNPSVVSVDQNGNITALASGSATIRATVHYKISSNYALTDVYSECKVTVS